MAWSLMTTGRVDLVGPALIINSVALLLGRDGGRHINMFVRAKHAREIGNTRKGKKQL